MYVCNFPHNSGTAELIWINFFLLAPSWSRGGFRPKKIRIQDPVFPEILNQICFNTNKFLDWVSGFSDPESGFSGKIWQKSGLTVYHDVIYHFSYSNHGKFIFGNKSAIWRIFSKFSEDFSRLR